MPYTVTAIRNDEKMQSVRSSGLIALAKARVWESEGWLVSIVDPNGRERDVAELDALTSFRPEKLTSLSAIFSGDLSRSPKAAAPARASDDAMEPEEVHGPWRAETHGPWRIETYGPWLAEARSPAAEKALALASS